MTGRYVTDLVLFAAVYITAGRLIWAWRLRRRGEEDR